MVLTAAGQDGSLSSWKLAGQEVCPKRTRCLSQEHRELLELPGDSTVCSLPLQSSGNFEDPGMRRVYICSFMYMAAVLCSCSHVGVRRRCLGARPACTPW